ncbi:MAG: hypothetical protein J0I25_03910, partial [Sphingomonadales bacterium]|nr:hypothetical protein [Sphingomonadales bacterium]
AGLGEWKWLHTLAPYIFFIYLLHEPVLSYLSQWTRGVPLAGSTAAQLGYTLGLAAATTLACLGLGLALKRLLPPAYSLLTGGR